MSCVDKFPEDSTFQLMNPGVYSVTMEASEIINGELEFKPQEVSQSLLSIFVQNIYMYCNSLFPSKMKKRKLPGVGMLFAYFCKL